MTVPVHAAPCMSADTAWTGRAVGREANEGGPYLGKSQNTKKSQISQQATYCFVNKQR